jgi:hypothetical protein
MSKCDLSIEFDRADRRYSSGEEVTGTVHVQVNQNVHCDGLLLETFWQTHGRGNTDTGPKRTAVLFEGDWLAGTRHRFPFRFTAPDGPPTYHGHDLNIDQYVNVRVDVPWAIDPKLKEDYVLLPGGRPYGDLPTVKSKKSGTRFLTTFGAPIGIGMIVAGFFIPFGLVLIPFGLALIFFGVRKVLTEKKIGKVQLDWGPLTVAPGAEVPVRLTFTPRKSCRLNGVAAKLTAEERCTSGSGTNRTTHTHRVHERTVPLVGECDLVAFEPVRAEAGVPIPKTGAYSFSADDNELVWGLEVRIDIPLWPDWLENRVLTVRPAVEAAVAEEPAVVPQIAVPSFEKPGAAVAEPVPEVPHPIDEAPDERGLSGEEPTIPEITRPFDSEFEEVTEPTEPVAPPTDVPASTESQASEATLLDIVDRLLSASRFGREREEIIQGCADQSFECTVKIDRVERVFGYVPEDRFRSGRSVHGVLAGTECHVLVQMASEHNEKLDACHPGDTIHATCRLLKWNSIYDRLDMQEA